jgi:hypothetical protein
MHARAGQNTLLQLYRIGRIAEMARTREEPMWAVLDWAATQPGEFTIRDMFRIWAKSGGGGDNAAYQQFSTAINNYIFKFDPKSPKAKYRNPKYKYIRVGKTEKGTVPAPLEYVTRGARGAGNAAVLRWRPGISPMRQPQVPKARLADEGDPVGDALDKLERKMGRPALKSALQSWERLGDIHKITAAIMADVQIRGRDKALAMQVAVDRLMKQGRITPAQADRAEHEVEDEVGGSPDAGGSSGFEDDEPTQQDAKPLFGGDDAEEDMPDDLLHGDDDAAGPASDNPVTPDDGVDADAGAEDDASQPPEEPAGSDEDEVMRGTLVNDEGERIEVTIQYDEEEGALVTDGERMYEPEEYNLEVANGVLTQEAFDALEQEGWSLVAADQGEDAAEEEPPPEEPEGDGEGAEEPVEEPEADSGEEPGDVGDPEEGEFPAFVPDPDEEGDKYERAMFVLVDEGDLREDNPLWGQLRRSKDAADAHQVIMRSGLPKGLHKYALTVARAIFQNTGRDFDTGKKNESRLLSLYSLAEDSALKEPVDFNQETGLERLYRVRSGRR